MKYFTALFIFFTLLTAVSPRSSFAASDPRLFPNNQFGIHLLDIAEIDKAAELVNSSGGDWGYITVVLQSPDRNLEKWQDFMTKAEKLHLIPIVRLATYPKGAVWTKPSLYDAVDFANFLNSLKWPVKNRYILVYNEPNRAEEWENDVSPDEYARILSGTIEIFKSRSEDFFMLNAGFDAAAPNNRQLTEEFLFLFLMNKSAPGIFEKLDGWASHSYPNPDFSSSPYFKSRPGILTFSHELKYLQRNYAVSNLPVFITETGWRGDNFPQKTLSEFYKIAFTQAWNSKNIVAVTPFTLDARDGNFAKFSWLQPDGREKEQFKTVSLLPKVGGRPELEPISKINLSANLNGQTFEVKITRSL